MARRDKKRKNSRQKQKTRSRLIIGGIIGGAVILVGAAAAAIIFSSRPMGESQPILGRDHVPDGSLPVQVSVEPPTSGNHYADPAAHGFYDTVVPDGNIIHSEEHGYVIIWYNCANLDDTACTALKDQVKSMVDEFNSEQLIGAPRDGMGELIALTSWGRIDKLDWFDANRIRAFIKANRAHAPENVP